MNHIESNRLAESLTSEEVQKALQEFEIQAQQPADHARISTLTGRSERAAYGVWELLYCLHLIHISHSGNVRQISELIQIHESIRSSATGMADSIGFEATFPASKTVMQKLDSDDVHLDALTAIASDLRASIKQALAIGLFDNNSESQQIRGGFVAAFELLSQSIERIETIIEGAANIVAAARASADECMYSNSWTAQLDERNRSFLMSVDHIMDSIFEQIGVCIEASIGDARQFLYIDDLDCLPGDTTESARFFLNS